MIVASHCVPSPVNAQPVAAVWHGTIAFVPATRVKVRGLGAIFVKTRVKHVAIKRDPDDRGMILNRGRDSRRTICDGVVMIPNAQIHMAPTIIERRQCMRRKDRVTRRGPVDPRTTKCNANTGVVRGWRRCFRRNRLNRNDIGLGGGSRHIADLTLDTVLVPFRVDIGSRGSLTSLKRVRHPDLPGLGIEQLKFVIGTEL